MRTLLAIACIVLSLTPALGADEEFKCLDGAKDSGYTPGNVVRWCQIEEDGRLLYHGPVWRWHRNGKMESKEYYIFGAAEGYTPSWYENGQPSSQGFFKDGNKVGLWKYWDEQGHITTEVTYSEAGHARTDYYSSGARKAVGVFRSTGKVGKWTYWDAQGKEKARCDFGEGVFTVPSKTCQIIADELEPEGYSRPTPVATVGPGSTCSLRVANQQYVFSVPSGWVADSEAGKEERASLAFYKKGGGWRDSYANMYIRPIFKDGASFVKVQADETEGLQEEVADYEEKGPVRVTRSNGMQVARRTIRYRPLQHTDSPFAIVSDNTIHEVISYVNASAQVVLMVVLTSPTENGLKASGAAFDSLVRSVKRQAVVERKP